MPGHSKAHALPRTDADFTKEVFATVEDAISDGRLYVAITVRSRNAGRAPGGSSIENCVAIVRSPSQFRGTIVGLTVTLPSRATAVVRSEHCTSPDEVQSERVSMGD